MSSPFPGRLRLIAMAVFTKNVLGIEESGTDIRTVPTLMGHTRVETTMIYLHVLKRPGAEGASPSSAFLAWQFLHGGLKRRMNGNRGEIAFHAAFAPDQTRVLYPGQMPRTMC